MKKYTLTETQLLALLEGDLRDTVLDEAQVDNWDEYYPAIEEFVEQEGCEYISEVAINRLKDYEEIREIEEITRVLEAIAQEDIGKQYGLGDLLKKEFDRKRRRRK